MAAYTPGRPLAAISVSSAMTRQVRSCRATDSIADALKMMQNNQLRRLPVVDNDDGLLGILSLADAAREAARERGRRSRDVTDAQVAEVLEAICRARAAGELAVSSV